jgi:recombination associated protein RdgC
MWFKNLRIYRLSPSFSITPEALEAQLDAHRFAPCGNLDLARYGWVPPLGRHGTQLVHTTDGNLMVCAKKQEKILPGAVVNEHLEERLAAISQAEGRRVSRRERQDVKDEIIFSLLPKAFSRTRLDFAYLDTKAQFIAVNAASAKRAEELLSALRQALGSLPCVPLTSQVPPVHCMSRWLEQGHADQPFALGDECELQAPKDGRVVRVKKQDLSAEEIRNHLTVGLVVQKMALQWSENLTFILDDQLSIKRLKFSDVMTDKANEKNPDTAADTFDSDMAIMAPAIREFISALLQTLGGETLPDHE